jgi:hypothetical protein
MNGRYQPTDGQFKQLRRAQQFIEESRRLQQRPQRELVGVRQNFQSYMEYMRAHPSKEIQRECRKLLKRRGREYIAGNNDILVNPWDSPKWMHKEMYIRLRCLQLVERIDTCRWWEHGFKGERDTELNSEGWLLVENYHLVGAAKFSRLYFEPKQKFVWSFDLVYIDPEHRCKGYTSKRIGGWIEKYGNFILDQPNPAARGMLRKSGYYDVLPQVDMSFNNLGWSMLLVREGDFDKI